MFRESVRDKVLYNLVLFAILMIGASYLLGQLTAGQDVKIVKDLGLAAMSLFGLFIAVFIGIGLVSKEVERRSIYSLLAKPIHRYQLVLGKYAGLVLTLVVNVAIMAAGPLRRAGATSRGSFPRSSSASLGRAGRSIPRILKAVGLILVELSLVTAIALFFSTFSTPILSAAFTFGALHRRPFQRRPPELRAGRRVAVRRRSSPRGLYWVLPNLAPFDVKAQVVHGQPVPLGFVVLDGRLRADLYRRPADRRRDDLFATGLQVDDARGGPVTSRRRRRRAWSAASRRRRLAAAVPALPGWRAERVRLSARDGERPDDRRRCT